jgi:predicted deacylase
MTALSFDLPCPDIAVWRQGNTGTEGVWHFDAGTPGRHVLISALIHGNELCGAWALKGLLEAGIRPTAGRLTLMFANLSAFDRFDAANHDASRFVDEDMNRQWMDERIAEPRTLERQRVAALAPWVRQADWVLDLHSMHESGAPLLLTGVQPRNLQLARALANPVHIVVDAGHKDGVRMRDYARLGLPDAQAPDTRSLLIECGFHGDPASRDVARDMCARFLAVSGAVSEATLQDSLPGWKQAIPLYSAVQGAGVHCPGGHGDWRQRRRTRHHALRRLRARHALGAAGPRRRDGGALCTAASADRLRVC